MSEMSNKALIIAVSLFITISITSSILLIMSHFKDIYAEVEKTDINIGNRFTEFDKYDNTTLTGLDVKNTIKKYQNNSLVTIDGAVNKKSTISKNSYSSLYTSTVTINDKTVTQLIDFGWGKENGFYKKPLGIFTELIKIVLDFTDQEDSYGAASIIEDYYPNELKSYLLTLINLQIDEETK